MFELVIREGKIITPDGWEMVDIGISEGKIQAIGEISESAKKEIKAVGKYIFPGGVDLHVHFNEPGRTDWEGFFTGTQAALAGGVTTLAEMPLNSIPSTVSVDALEKKLSAIGAQSHADFGLWGGLVPGNVEELIPLARAGVMGFKAFMSPSGTDDFINADIRTLRMGMERIAETGLRLAIHAEDPQVLKLAGASLASKTSAYDWERSRPIAAEISAVEIAIDLSVQTGCPITIVHVSSHEVLTVIEAAKKEGVDIIAETCPHYLLLNIDDAHRIGTLAKCAPPLRLPAVQDALWQALFRGLVDTIGSDHSPAPPIMKEGKSFYDAWGGISGLQHGLPLLLDKISFADEKDTRRLTRLFAGRPAQVAAFSTKGELRVGKDADFFLWQKGEQAHRIAERDLLYRHSCSAYVGLPLQGEIVSTYLRGELVYDQGKFTAPRGKFIKGGRRNDY